MRSESLDLASPWIGRAGPGDGGTLRDLAKQRRWRHIDAAGLPADFAARVRESVDDARVDEDLLDCDAAMVARGDDGRVLQAVLWRDGHHPITDQPGRVFTALLDSPLGEAHDLRSVFEAACADAPDETSQLRTDVSAQELAGPLGRMLLDAGFQEHNLVVRKIVASDIAPAATPDAVFRALDHCSDTERAFALSCVRGSIIQGLTTEPVGEAEAGRAAGYAEAWLDGLDGVALRSYVIEHEQALVAHALVSMASAWQSTETEATIVDIAVPDIEQRGRGWSRLLTSRIEQVAAQEGVRVLAATVAALDGHRPQALLDNLLRAGWRVDSITMLRRLVGSA